MSHPLYFHWTNENASKRFSTGVSLHSHTHHSKELLDFIPRFAARIPALRWEVQRLSEQFERLHGCPLDFRKGWWTPPLDPVSAVKLEAGQIQRLGLRPLVSLTDHDSLQAHNGGRHLASVELTVPLEPSFVHLGIHNLPPARAHEVLAYGAHPAALMGWLGQFPDALVVFNHPLWDEAGVGVTAHRAMVERFLARHERDIHALELNGLRPWKENALVIDMAKAWGLPVISGGDRHGLEPNANINLTDALTFDDFVDEVRYERQSTVLFLPQYRRPYALRIISNLMEIIDNQPDHALGWRRWSDRVFYEIQPGVARSLSEYWPGGEPALVRFFLMLMQVLRISSQFPPLRMASGLLEECRP